MAKIKTQNEWGLFRRSLLLAFVYALLWSIVHQLSHFPNPGGWVWIFPQLVASTLIFFTLNGLFASFSSYQWGFLFQLIVASFYIHPVFHVLYYKTYQAPMDQQILSLVLREPKFLAKVLASEMTWFRGAILGFGVILFYGINAFVLKRKKLKPDTRRPYDLFLNRWSLIFIAIMVVLQIMWCLEHDRSMLIMRPLYPVVLMMLVSVMHYLLKSHKSIWERSFVAGLIIINLIQLYAFNLAFGDYRYHFSLETQYYRSMFGAYFVQAGFGSLGQDESVHEKFRKLPDAKMDYNILFVLNDTQRWDKLSSHGYPRPTDDALDWIYKQSFNFQFPISSSNSTDTSVPALLSGYSSEQDVRTIKSSLVFWDYFAKGAETFMISSQDITWSKLDLFYKSIGLEYLWSATAQPNYHGNPEDVDDVLSFQQMKEHVSQLKGPWVGLWQTFASHFPYTVPASMERYQPCERQRTKDIHYFENCYLNAQVYSSSLRSDFYKSIDLDKTIIVMTSDHGEGLGEHGVFYHGTDFHQEIVKVPFFIYIPQSLQKKLPTKAIENIQKNTKRVVSTIDILPTLLHLHQMLTGQTLRSIDDPPLTGKSLFENWDYRVVFSSGCFPQYRCYSRETLFADDEYYVIFRPSEGFYKIYRTHEDLQQTSPLLANQIDLKKLKKLVDESAQIHVAGKSMKSFFETTYKELK